MKSDPLSTEDLDELQRTPNELSNGPNRNIRILAAIAATLMFLKPQSLAQTVDSGHAPKHYAALCQGCHGEGGSGGDRAPALIDNRGLRLLNEEQIQAIIKNGTRGGMPGFPLPESDLRSIARWVHSLNSSAFDSKAAGDVRAGEQFFFGKGQCATCHMVKGRGKVNGPDLSDIGRKSTLREIELVLTDPTSQMGMHTTPACPSWAFCPDESWAVVDVTLRDGSKLRGFARNRAEHDIQLQTLDGKFHFLTGTDYREIVRRKKSLMPPLNASPEERRNLVAYLSSLGGAATGPATGDPEPVPATAIQAVMRPKPGEWPTYHGQHTGNRFSPLNQIHTQNVGKLQVEWIYSLGAAGSQTTPIVSEGLMYVTAPGQVCALDSGTGREIWCYKRPASGADSGQPNRGVAALGDRIFFTPGDAHLVCLNRLTGAVMWDVNMPESPGRYFATSAPLVVGDLVISGIAGGDGPIRGFIAAYQAATGRQVWRFWTVPKPGEPGSETWTGKAISTGGGATWVTGSYDMETGTLYWTVGNPFPATDGDEREGVNLYTNCVLALEAKTGKLRWYYQFTPHDLHDWDATEPVVLVDTKYKNRDRKLLLQANRNGFAYLLDRINGELLLAKPFVKKLNWASGIGPDGKPLLLPANKPTTAGVKTCPAVRGATNWYSTAFDPATRLFYMMAVEDCSIYRQSQDGGYEGYRDPNDSGLKYLRAFNIDNGNIAWEIPQIGPQEANYSGVLATAGGIVFYGETGGGFAAVDSKSGRHLWSFRGNEPWKASPMTYTVNGRQFVAIASGSNILAFALPGSK